MRAYVLFVVFLKNGSQANNWLQDHIMKAHLEWTDKPESGIKRKVRITFLKGQTVKWQFKRSDEELLKLMLAPTKVQPVLRTAEPTNLAISEHEDTFSANVIL